MPTTHAETINPRWPSSRLTELGEPALVPRLRPDPQPGRTQAFGGAYPLVVFRASVMSLTADLLGLAHFLAVLSVSGCDILGQRDDEPAIFVDLFRRRLAL